MFAAHTLRRQGLRFVGRAWPSRPSRLTDGRAPRVLLIRPDHIGDVLLTSPAVALLDAALPAAEMRYLVGPWSRDAALHGPRPDAVRTIAFPGFTREAKRGALDPYALLWSEARTLRRERFDLAIVFRPDHWWGALLARVAGIPLRVGYATPETTPLLTHARPLLPNVPATLQAFTLVSTALPLLGRHDASGMPMHMFEVRPEEQQAAEALLAALGLAEARLVAIHPAAGAALKSWPPRRWAVVIQALRAAGFMPILTGGPGDQAAVAAVQAALPQPAAELPGLPLGVFAAVLRRCALAIGPDSGALHLAAAVGTPTLRLYGPASAAVYGPWPARPDQVALSAEALRCVPCGYLAGPPCGAITDPPCMLSVDTQTIIDAALQVLERAGVPESGGAVGGTRVAAPSL